MKYLFLRKKLCGFRKFDEKKGRCKIEILIGTLSLDQLLPKEKKNKKLEEESEKKRNSKKVETALKNKKNI